MGHFTSNHHTFPTSKNILTRITTLVWSKEQAPLKPDLLRPKSYLQTPHAGGKAVCKLFRSQLWGILGYPGNEAEICKEPDQKGDKRPKKAQPNL